MSSRVRAGALFVSFCWCLAAQERIAAPPAKPDPLQSEQAKRGRTQFSQSCAFCHGANATGGAEGPNLMRSSLVRHDNAGDLIGPVIREGRPNAGMPPVPLNQNQIADVVAYLHAQLAVSDRTSAGRPRSNYSLKRLLTGSAAAGKAYFFGAGRCSSCHSPTGDLRGLAKKYPPVELQSRFLYPAGKPKTVVVTLPSGQKARGELLHLDQFYVAIQDEDGWYHSWPCREVAIEVTDPLAAHLELLGRYKQPDVHNLFAYLETLQ